MLMQQNIELNPFQSCGLLQCLSQSPDFNPAEMLRNDLRGAALTRCSENPQCVYLDFLFELIAAKV